MLCPVSNPYQSWLSNATIIVIILSGVFFVKQFWLCPGYEQRTAIMKKITKKEMIPAAVATEFGVLPEESADLFKGAQKLIAVYFQ